MLFGISKVSFVIPHKIYIERCGLLMIENFQDPRFTSSVHFWNATMINTIWSEYILYVYFYRIWNVICSMDLVNLL